MKLVINRTYGGFHLSHECMMRYAELKGFKLFAYKDLLVTKQGKVDVQMIPLTEKDDKDYAHYYKEKDNFSEESYFSRGNIPRNDPALVQAVEELGDKANTSVSKLKVVEIPDDVEFVIEEYDGVEWVSEKRRTWR